MFQRVVWADNNVFHHKMTNLSLKFCSYKIIFQPILDRGSVMAKERYWCPKCPKPFQRLSIKPWPEKYHHGKKHSPLLSCIGNCKMKLTMPCHLPSTSSEQPELVSSRWALNSNEYNPEHRTELYVCFLPVVFFLITVRISPRPNVWFGWKHVVTCCLTVGEN